MRITFLFACLVTVLAYFAYGDFRASTPLSAQIATLEKQQKVELKELKTTQKAREKAWEEKEQKARHAFFAGHPKGADRREYIHDFIHRRLKLLKSFADEHEKMIKEQKAHLAALKDSAKLEASQKPQ